MVRQLPQVRQVPMPEIELSNFRGLNNRDAITEVGNNESTDLRNVGFDTKGGITKRGGTALVGDDKGDLLTHGIHSCYYANGSAHLLMASQSATTSGLWYRTTGVYAEAVLNGATKLANADTEFENFYDGANEMTFITDGTTYQKYQASTHKIIAATASPATVGSSIKVYKNRMYSVGGSSAPERVYYSGLGDGDSWGANDWFDVPSQSATEAGRTGDPITALVVFQERLIIFKNRSIWYYDTHQLREITDKHGCVNKRAVTATGDFLYFADNDGVYRLSGNYIDKASKKIQATWDVIPAGRMVEVAMTYFDDKLFVATSAAGGANNNIVLVNWLRLPPDEEGQTPWSYWEGTAADPIAVKDWAVYEATTTTLPILVYGCAHAQSVTLQLDTGTADYDFSVGTSTAAIASYYKTKSFYLSARYKRLFAVYKTQSAASYLSVGYDVDFGNRTGTFNFDMKQAGDVYGTGKYGTAIYGGQTAIIARGSVSERGKYIQYTFQNNNASQPWTLYQIKQLFKPIRIR